MPAFQGLRVLTILAAAACAAVSAAAQPVQEGGAPRNVPRSVTWTVEFGYQSFWQRGVGRTTRALDASPVSWRGDGPGSIVRYDRATPKRLHRFAFSWSSAGHFVYDAIVKTIPRPAEDHQWRVGGRYEHRRYPFRDLWVGGLDVGIGVQGLADHVSFTRRADPAIEIGRSDTNLGVSVVAAARFHRWQKLDVEVAWANGMMLSRTHTRHSEDVQASRDQWGGGWLADLVIMTAVPVSGRTSIVASCAGAAFGNYASHNSYSSGGRRFFAGVKYDR